MRNYLQRHSTRAWAYRAGRWVFGELTPDELQAFKLLPPNRTRRGPVRFPIHPGVFFGGGYPVSYVTWFARCRVQVNSRLPHAVEYPTEVGRYDAYLWKDQADNYLMMGCDVEVIEGFAWIRLTPPTKSPPRPPIHKERTFIYALVDPLTHKVFYVGETYKPEQRLIRHLHDTSNHWKLERIQQLHIQGHFPLLMILEELDATVAKERENWWTAYYQSLGHNLTNYCCQRLKKSSIR